MSTDARLFAKCGRRLVPLMGLLYAVCLLDRGNVAFAALGMNEDLGFSATIYGLGASMFFVGFVLFQVPSNLMLERIGARRWIAFLLVAWGTIGAAFATVENPAGLYSLRFLLGMAEAGFLPGMVLYLSYWFPNEYRARFNAAFLLGLPVARICGGPLAGLLMQLDHVAGLAGWRWLFLLEGVPAVLLGLAVLKLLPDGPASAPWLLPEEKNIIAARLANEYPEHRDFWPAMRDTRVYILGLVGFGIFLGADTMTFWLPLIVKNMGFSNLATGFVVTVPWFASGAAMILWGRSSDRTGERIWHVVLPTLLSAAGFALAGAGLSSLATLIGLTCAIIGFTAYLSPFYALAASFLAGRAAAGGIAAIYSLCMLSGVVGPVLMGMLKDRTGGYTAGLATLSCTALLSALILLAIAGMLAPRRTGTKPGQVLL